MLTRKTGAQLRRDAFTNEAGVTIKSVYTGRDLAETGFDEERELARPGEFPYTRGVDTEGQRAVLPSNSCYAGFGTPEETNDRYKKLLGWGAQCISMAVDLPTQLGYDSDHPMSGGEVGRVGVAIDSLADMEAVWRDIPLSSLESVGMLGNAIGPIALALFIALGEKQGLTPDQYRVELQNDVLKEYVARGTQFLPIRPAVRLAIDPVLWCAEHAPHWRPMTVSANHIEVAGAGSTAASAFAVTNALCYVDEMVARGARPEAVLPLLAMFVNERLDFFLLIANFRATRRLWARLIQERYGVDDPDSLALRLTSYAHGRETRLEPENNIARQTISALAAYLAGVQLLSIASYDEALNVPSEAAVKQAIRIHQIIGHEHGITSTVDPLGGSYFLETMTHEVESKMQEYTAKVLSLGGAVEAIETGYYQKVIVDGAIRRQREYDRGGVWSVGVNLFQDPAVSAPDSTFTVNAEAEACQAAGLERVRARRDSARVAAALAAVRETALGDGNLVPPVLEAVRAYATVGEISAIFREVFGEWQPDRSF